MICRTKYFLLQWVTSVTCYIAVSRDAVLQLQITEDMQQQATHQNACNVITGIIEILSRNTHLTLPSILIEPTFNIRLINYPGYVYLYHHSFHQFGS